MFTQTDLFIGGQQGYHTYRIPAMTVSTRGTVLAFCEGRRYSSSDTGDIDLILKRSFDDGRTWEPTQTVVTEPATDLRQSVSGRRQDHRNNMAAVLQEPGGWAVQYDSRREGAAHCLAHPQQR